MENHDAAPLGTIARPYRLHWPIDRYRSAGKTFGSTFDEAEIERARRRGHKRLGLKQYRPSGKEAACLDIPPGSYVECYLIRDGIHDQSYYNMKNLGKSTSPQKQSLSNTARKTVETMIRIDANHRQPDRAVTVKEAHSMVPDAVGDLIT